MSDKRRSAGAGSPSVERTLWAYGYEMVPPHQARRLSAIRGLLARENEAAQHEARTWTARLVTERQATHVLIVSSTPEQDLEVNRKLEAELKALGVEFMLTVPMAVGDAPAPDDA